MMAILTTAGPVSSYKAVQYTRRNLHCLKRDQFVKAASELEQANLGTLIKLQRGGGVFIKKTPDEIGDSLGPFVDLCSYDIYRKRYQLPTSKSISFSLRAKLVTARLVPEKLFI